VGAYPYEIFATQEDMITLKGIEKYQNINFAFATKKNNRAVSHNKHFSAPGILLIIVSLIAFACIYTGALQYDKLEQIDYKSLIQAKGVFIPHASSLSNTDVRSDRTTADGIELESTNSATGGKFSAEIINKTGDEAMLQKVKESLATVDVTTVTAVNEQGVLSEETTLYFLDTVPDQTKKEIREQLSKTFENVVELQTDQPANADITIALGKEKEQ
jgi:hypothetical protein